MKYEEIFRKALKEIESTWGLPKSGFIAGGSLANTVWNIVSGNSAPINDIDIYVLDKTDSNYANTKRMESKQHFSKMVEKLFEDYSGNVHISYNKNLTYAIENITWDGIYNYINYSSCSIDKKIIIDSFDLNCCQIGYDIDTDKFIFTDDFMEFINTGYIKITNLCSPAHTAIRIVKKKNELNAKVSEFEYDLLTYVINKRCFFDVRKFRFKERYKNIYEKYQDELNTRFELKRDLDCESFISIHFKSNDKIWYLSPKLDSDKNVSDFSKFTNRKEYMYEPFLDKQYFSSVKFLYYIRNATDKIKISIFNLLDHFIDKNMKIDEYIDCDLNREEILKLSRLMNFAPNTHKYFHGLTLSKQLEIFNKVSEIYKNEPYVGITVLENYDLIKNNINDDIERLIMELSIRRKIKQDRKNKVSKIYQSGE